MSFTEEDWSKNIFLKATMASI